MTKYIDMALITIPPDRQRKDFDPGAMQELCESIQARGLINAISLYDDNSLIAGERRLRACQDLVELGVQFCYDGERVPVGMIPFTSFSELSPLEIMLIEFEENTKRKELTWQETSIAISRIAELVRGIAEERGVSAKRPEIEEAVHAAGLELTTGGVATDIIIARNINNPAMAGAKNRKEAIKALIRDETSRKYAADAERVGTELKTTDYKVYNMNCFSMLDVIIPGSIDVICTDPPYGMGADEFGDSGKAVMGEHFYRDSPAELHDIMQAVPELLFKVAKPDAHLYLFCDIDHFHDWRNQLANAGWKCFRTPIIWYKPSTFRAPWPDHGPQRKYEIILYARKGEKTCTRLYPDVINCQPDANLGHQAQKPVALFTDLLRRSVRPGDLVFDPFCGTGPIFDAAKELNCKAIGMELDQTAFGIALGRLK